jgi:hypothetical protein
VSDRTHRVETLHEVVRGEDVYYGRCATCGWRGTNWKGRDLAQASANGHFVFPEMVVPSKLRITLEPQPTGVAWKVWRGITEQYELLGEGEAFTWAAATHQAGTLITELMS